MVSKRHEVTDPETAEVAIKDLCSYSFPYPEPLAVPTLALICSREHEITAAEVLRLGYRGYLRTDDGEPRLEQALQALLRARTGPSERSSPPSSTSATCRS